MTLYTIGHGNVPAAALISLLQQHEIELLVDVRSQPYSRFNPQFNRETIKQTVQAAGIAYGYMGNAIGGIPSDQRFYLPNGNADYDLLEQAEFYQEGIARLLDVAAECRLAAMCAEKDYHHCHRYHLITRTLVRRAIQVLHILHSGKTEESVAADFERAQSSFF